MVVDLSGETVTVESSFEDSPATVRDVILVSANAPQCGGASSSEPASALAPWTQGQALGAGALEGAHADRRRDVPQRKSARGHVSSAEEAAVVGECNADDGALVKNADRASSAAVMDLIVRTGRELSLKPHVAANKPPYKSKSQLVVLNPDGKVTDAEREPTDRPTMQTL